MPLSGKKPQFDLNMKGANNSSILNLQVFFNVSIFKQQVQARLQNSSIQKYSFFGSILFLFQVFELNLFQVFE